MKPIYSVVIAVVALAAGFFGGMQYQKSQGNASFSAGGMGGRFQGQGQFFQRNGGTGRGTNGGRVVGSILNMDSSSMTVKMPDGSTKIVILSGTTTYSKSTQGTVSDLKPGDTVAVFGSNNSDGSVTAQNIQIGQFLMRGGNTPPPNNPQNGAQGQ